MLDDAVNMAEVTVHNTLDEMIKCGEYVYEEEKLDGVMMKKEKMITYWYEVQRCSAVFTAEGLGMVLYTPFHQTDLISIFFN